MAISKKKQAEKEARERAHILTKWRMNGQDPKEAEKLGILPLFTEQLSELQKQEAKIHLEAAKHSDELEELQKEALRLWKADKKSALAVGKILVKVQEKMASMPHGAFKRWWVAEGLQKNRVSYCMRLASPKGNKVKESKERRARTPRAVAFSLVNDKLQKLWKLGEENNTQKANELYQEIISEIKERFIANLKKSALKTMAATA
jgi:cell fate (sporulation/competence/biofilm development) regulator YmcA (YheA/YmcA/DUF963 family)